MPPKGSKRTGNSDDTVRQTIVETLEAPRLRGIETSDFVTFKQKREVYERRVQEKIAEQGVAIPATTYRNSIEKPVLEIFITAQWVPVPSIDDITEEHLKDCVEDRAKIQTEDYDLAQIERGIKHVKLEKSKNLEIQVWGLGLRYATTLDKLGYSKFIEKQPYLAVQHILKRITHEHLLKRMKLTYKLRKEEFKKDYNLFMRELAKEAKAVDRHEAAAGSHAGEVNSDSDLERHASDNHNRRGNRRGRKPNKGHKPGSSGGSGAKDTGKSGSAGDKSWDSKKRDKPDCLNPDCHERHFLNECPNTSAEKKKRLLEAYHAAKKSKTGKGNAGNIGQLASPQAEENSSLFSATFCSDAVEATVLADQGSDVNLLPPHVLDMMRKADKSLTINVLDRTYYYSTVDKTAPSLPCSRKVKANITLRVRHAANLVMRGMEWMVSDRPVQNVLISRHVLKAIGLDNRKLLAAACDRFKGIINVPDLLQTRDEAGPQHEEGNRTRQGSIHSLLQDAAHEFGSTFHSQAGAEQDNLDDSNVYVDIGDDPEEDLDAALAERVGQASRNGMSDKGTKKLAVLLHKHKQVFE